MQYYVIFFIRQKTMALKDKNNKADNNITQRANRITIMASQLNLIVHRSAAVANAADGRHTHCSTVVTRAYDGRRTMRKPV